MLRKRKSTFYVPLVLVGLTATVLLAVPVFLTGCRKPAASGQLIKTWDAAGEEIPPVIYEPPLEALPPAKAKLWAGTVSHHLLADKQIDSWFSEIAKHF